MDIILTVIVPIYNAERYINKCIESITSQTIKEIEIILINDGSTDKSKEIIDEYASIDNRIVSIHNENKGPSATRNEGINIAKGKYIGFVDSDDSIDSTMYQKLIAVALENDAQIAMCNYKDITLANNSSYEVKHNLNINGVKNKEYIRENIIKTFTRDMNYGFFSLCNKIYLKSWIEEIDLLLDESRMHGEDWWFNISAFMKLEKFVCIEEGLYNYIHRNPESLMLKYREEQFDLCLDGRLKLLYTIPEELIDKKALNRRFVYEFSSYIIRTIENVKDKEKCKNIIKKVVCNNEVINCCKEVDRLPTHFKLTALMIKFRLSKCSILLYKLISRIR